MKRQGQMPILCVQFFSFSSSSLILLLSVISESFVLLAEPSNHRSLHSRLVRFSCRCFSSCNILKPFTSSNVYSDDFVCISSTYGCCWLPLFSLQWMDGKKASEKKKRRRNLVKDLSLHYNWIGRKISSSFSLHTKCTIIFLRLPLPLLLLCVWASLWET